MAENPPGPIYGPAMEKLIRGTLAWVRNQEYRPVMSQNQVAEAAKILPSSLRHSGREDWKPTTETIIGLAHARDVHARMAFEAENREDERL